MNRRYGRRERNSLRFPVLKMMGHRDCGICEGMHRYLLANARNSEAGVCDEALRCQIAISVQFWGAHLDQISDTVRAAKKSKRASREADLAELDHHMFVAVGYARYAKAIRATA